MGLWGSFGSLVFRHFAQTATSEVYELLYNRYFGRGCLVGDKPFVIITVMIADRRRGTMRQITWSFSGRGNSLRGQIASPWRDLRCWLRETKQPINNWQLHPAASILSYPHPAHPKPATWPLEIIQLRKVKGRLPWPAGRSSLMLCHHYLCL